MHCTQHASSSSGRQFFEDKQNLKSNTSWNSTVWKSRDEKFKGLCKSVNNFYDKCLNWSRFSSSSFLRFYNSSSQMLQCGMTSKSCRQNPACQPEGDKLDQAEKRRWMFVLASLPVREENTPLIIAVDKWLSRANTKVNKWLQCLFAQGFLHNKAKWEDANSRSKKAPLPFFSDFVCPPSLRHQCSSQRATFLAPGWVPTTK